MEINDNRYTAIELCRLFNLPADTIKRWGREFLPPDPIAKQAAGRRRMFGNDDAYTIFLVQELIRVKRFSIPDTRKIIEELKPWLISKRIWPGGLFKIDKKCTVFVRKADTGFDYVYRENIQLRRIEYQGRKIYEELYFLGSVGETRKISIDFDLDEHVQISVTAIALRFKKLMAIAG